MNPTPKRYRQTNIFECFALNKKQKTTSTDMSNRVEIRDLMLRAAENRSSTLPSVSDVARNCNGAKIKELKVGNKDIVNLEACSSKLERNGKNNDNKLSGVRNNGNNPGACSTKSGSKIRNNDIDSGTSCLNSLFESKIKNGDSVFDSEVFSIEPNDHKSNISDNESDFGNSAELFPDNPTSLEDYYVPSSSELFTEEKDSESQSVSAMDSNDEEESEEQEQLLYLNRSPDCCLPLPKLEPLENHFIMFSPYVRPGDAPRPYPSSYRDRWDSDHVRMPCSPMNKYPVEDRNGQKHIESRWNLICRSLSTEIESSEALAAAILKYNSQYAEKWSFQGLHDFINTHLTEAEQEHFFETMLPAMIKIALDLPKICTQPVPLLKKGRDRYITITQKQIACLLLNAFFCTFPRRNLPNRHHRQGLTCEYASYPDINFNRLFYGVKNKVPARNAEKLKCLFNYFRRITSVEPTGTVTFHRQCISSTNLPKWSESTRGIRTAVIKSSGVIEAEGHGMLEVDFANKFVGGGVIGQGCVQEEIRFIICPELIVSRLFVECLNYNEVLIITGVEQYSKYSGYADSFQFKGDFKDQTPRDSWGRRYAQLVAMDALHFRNPSVQFKSEFLIRELNKAFSGFYENALPVNLPAVATGNWGCGVYKGNSNLKFLIQLMAASEAGRSILYFTFGNKQLKTELQNMYKFLTDQNLSVGDVWRLLLNYSKNVSSKANSSELYDFIFSQYLIKEENCRQQEDQIGETQPLDESDERALEKLIEDAACEGSFTEIEDGACDSSSTEIEDASSS